MNSQSNALIEFLLENERELSWSQLAEKFNIKPDEDILIRAKAANDVWRGFLKKLKNKKLDLELVKQKFNNEGILLWETYQRTDVSVPDTTGMKLTKVTTGPYGSWKTFENNKEYGLTENQVKELKDKLSFDSFNVSIQEGSGIGVIDISDVHTGALVKVFSETVKQKPFNLDILISYMNQVAEITNSYNFKEVHLFLPGDIIESFTGFNHQDTYKNIQFHQGDIIIVAFQVLKRLIQSINNCTDIYLVEGNHDRLTSKKGGNSRKGVVEVLSYFLDESCDVNIHYQPFLVSAEIDNIHHICTHGDWRPFKNSGYDGFFFKYGKQNMFNVLRTGHYHRFNVLAQTPDYLHYECPSIFTGGLFEEFLGFHSVPAFTILRNFNDICSIDYRPLKLIINESSANTTNTRRNN